MSKKKSNDIETSAPAAAAKAEKTKKSGVKPEATGKASAVDSAKASAISPMETTSSKSTKKAQTLAQKDQKTSKKSGVVEAAAPAPEVVSPATPYAMGAANGTGAVHTVALASISRDEIAKLAYSYAEARGFQGGSPEADWHQAELELQRLRGL